MPTLIIVVVIIVAIVVVSAPIAAKLSQEMESRRMKRQIELERLQEENRRKYYGEYLKQKNKKRK